MIRSRGTRSVLLAIVALAALAPPITAAPAPFEGIPMTCEGLGDTVITSPGSDLSFTPGFIEGTNDLLVPYVVTATLSSDGSSTTTTLTKAAPLPAAAITCVFDVTLHFQGVTYHLSGSLTGLVVGQP